MHWYTLAANQDHPRAWYNLGLCYRQGRGVQQDDAEAARLFRLGADQGDDAARYQLADLYRTGKGVQQDEAAAFQLYSLAARDGDFPAAMRSLGLCYEQGVGVTQDLAKARE